MGLGFRDFSFWSLVSLVSGPMVQQDVQDVMTGAGDDLIEAVKGTEKDDPGKKHSPKGHVPKAYFL